MSEKTQNADEERQAPEEQTMESLLKEQSEVQDKLKKREVVWVKVVQSAKDQVLVDIGEKSEAVVPLGEFPEGAPAVGRRIPVILVKVGRGDQPTEMSTAKAQWRLGWEQVVKAHEEKARVKGRVTSAIKGGFLVNVNGVTGFMPSSQSDLRPVRKPDQMVGTGVRCYIIELDKAKEQIILSRRAVLEEDSLKRREKLIGVLQAGAVRIGRVMRVSALGVVVDIGGVEGLVHTEDVAWKDPEEAKKRLARGQKLRVKILRVESDSQKVGLGLKQLTPHPGDAIRKKHPLKSVVKGTVAEIKDDGVRITLAKGGDAFCPVRELPVDASKAKPDAGWDGGLGGRGEGPRGKREELPPIWPKEGEKVSAIVTGVHARTFEVAVSIRRFEAIQDRKRVAQYMKGAPPLTLGQLFNIEGEE